MIPEHRHLMTHALRDGVLVHIDDVANGKACNCVCPACKQPLMAKQGKKKTHHFAHQSSQDCQYGYETSLHYLAKEIIQQVKQFLLPPVCIPLGPRRSKTIQEVRMVSVRNAELEQRLGGIIPDIVLYTDGQPVLVEIYVTHPVNGEKKEKIRKIDLPMIEIDLSQVAREVTREALTEILLQKESQKKWVHCPDESHFFEEWRKAATSLKVEKFGAGCYTVNCPTDEYIDLCEKGITYTPVDRCYTCKYFLGLDSKEEGNFLCLGERQIETEEDLKQAFSGQRQRKIYESRKKYSITTWQQCPKCGNGLKLVLGKAGYFWGCERYPKCQGSRSLSTYQRLLLKGICPVCRSQLSEYQEEISGLQCENGHRFSLDGIRQSDLNSVSQDKVAETLVPKDKTAEDTPKIDVTLAKEFDPESEDMFIDATGNRWVFCTSCRRRKMSTEMQVYGGRGKETNKGICKGCWHRQYYSS